MKYFTLLISLCFLSLHVQSKDLTVGVEDIEYYPIYQSKGGVYGGYARELLDGFAKKYNHKLKYKPLPIKRLFSELINETVDLKFPDNKYWASDLKKSKEVKYSAPALEYIDGALMPPSKMGQDKNNNKKLGIIRGFTAWEYLGDIKSGRLKLSEVKKMSQLMLLVKSHRVDAIYFNVLVARYFLKHNDDFSVDLVNFDKSLPHTRDHYHLSTIKHPDVIAQFNEYLETHAADVAHLKAKFELEL